MKIKYRWANILKILITVVIVGAVWIKLSSLYVDSLFIVTFAGAGLAFIVASVTMLVWEPIEFEDKLTDEIESDLIKYFEDKLNEERKNG